VQAAARVRSKANGSAQGAVERLIVRLAAIYPKKSYSDPQSWPLCAHLTPHLLAQRDQRDDALVIADWAEPLSLRPTWES
jgi:hypothetical protein